VLPSDLTPKSSDPTVIAVTPGSKSDTIDFQALKTGQTDIEVQSAGQRYDWLTFHVEPARGVKFRSEPAVLAGGHFGVGIEEIYGACKSDECLLFGHGFIQWSIEPATALTLLEDNVGIAHFTGAAIGNGQIVGKEPSEGGELVRHPVEIVDPTTIMGLSGQLTVIPPGAVQPEEEPKPVPLPADVPINSGFTIRVDGMRAGKTPVAISRHDIEWTVPPGVGLVAQDEPADTVAELFSSGNMTGDFMLTAKVALLGGMQQTFVVKIVPAAQ
jgi:hypothetical protein